VPFGPDVDLTPGDRRSPPPGPDADLVAGDHRTPPPERSPDPEVRLQHAREVAWTALNRRDHTVAELARVLARKRVEPAVIDTVAGELCEQGYLDDARFAHRFAEDRRRLDGWGAERIQQRLLALGVERELVAAAVGEQDHDGELEAALALLQRRFPARLRAGARRADPQGLRARAGARRHPPPRRRIRVRLITGSSQWSSVRIAYGCRRYYDPDQRQVEPQRLLKTQQIDDFTRKQQLQ
jgi:regulatory protein